MLAWLWVTYGEKREHNMISPCHGEDSQSTTVFNTVIGNIYTVDVPFQHLPNVFYRFQVGGLRWPVRNVEIVVCKPIFCMFGYMYRSIVLQKSKIFTASYIFMVGKSQ